jgi:hypothetical protein
MGKIATQIRFSILKISLVVPMVLTGLVLKSQGVVFDNFEGTKFLYYGERTGVLDTLAKNPAPNKINASEKCGLYVRSGAKKFANIKMNLLQLPGNVAAYATYLGIPPKIKMKVYTSAPPGTLIEVLLGSRNGNNDYPAGTHSQYQAYTTVSNQWEELEFLFSQIPQGSETSASQINQAVLLFNPNSSTSDTYYFDDLRLPAPSETDSVSVKPILPGNDGSQPKDKNQQGESDRNNSPKVGNKKTTGKKSK